MGSQFGSSRHDSPRKNLVGFAGGAAAPPPGAAPRGGRESDASCERHRKWHARRRYGNPRFYPPRRANRRGAGATHSQPVKNSSNFRYLNFSLYGGTSRSEGTNPLRPIARRSSYHAR